MKTYEYLNNHDKEETLKVQISVMPLRDKKRFGGHFQVGDIIGCNNYDVVIEKVEEVKLNIPYIKVRVIRGGECRGIFVPVTFFTRCFFYKGDAAADMTCYKNVFEMLENISTNQYLIKVEEVFEETFEVKGVTRTKYNYKLSYVK